MYIFIYYNRGVVDMDEIIKTITQWDNKDNEDYLYASNQFSFILDGSTGLKKFNIFEGESDARWFANLLGNELKAKLHSNDSISNILVESLSQIRNQYTYHLKLLGMDMTSLNKVELPTASITVLRFNGKEIEYYQLGDCTTVLYYRDDTVEILHDDSVSVKDKSVIKSLIKYSYETGLSPRDCLPKIHPQLVENRNEYNTASGYWILDLYGTGIENAEQKIIPLENISSIAMMTDGFASVVDTVKLFDNYKELIKAMSKTPLNEIVDNLFEILENDVLLEKYPRFKLKDDASAIWQLLEK